MTSRDQAHDMVYRLITGGRSPATETVRSAIREIGRAFGVGRQGNTRGQEGAAKRAAAAAVGVSPETWRRWGLGTQKQTPAHLASLLAALRRARLRPGRESRIRSSGGPTVDAVSRYDARRRVGRHGLDLGRGYWTGWGPVVDAYLAGSEDLGTTFAGQITDSHYADWLDPGNDSTEGYDWLAIRL